jgi:hypothetical protein
MSGINTCLVVKVLVANKRKAPRVAWGFSNRGEALLFLLFDMFRRACRTPVKTDFQFALLQIN